MFQAFAVFLVILASTLIAPFTALNLATGLRLILAGIGLALTLAMIQIGEAKYLHRVIGAWLVASLAGVLFCVGQTLPETPLAHSVWASAATALGSSTFGHITVDVGATVMAILHLLVLISTVVLATSVMIDRERAELGLACLALVAALLVVIDWIKQPDPADLGIRQMVDCAIFGTLLASACGYLAFERYETRHAKQADALRRLGIYCLGSAAATLLCATAIVSQGTPAEMAVAAIAFVVFGGVIAARRIGVGAWTGLALMGLAFLGISFAAFNAEQPEWALLAYTDASPHLVELTRRMVEDAPWLGTGAGTIELLSGIYRGYDDPVIYQPPSLAVVLITELGWPASVLLLLLCLLATGSLLKKGFRRGRDSIYAILGTAVLVATLLLTFINSGLQNEAVSILLAGVFGLALAQCESRRS